MFAILPLAVFGLINFFISYFKKSKDWRTTFLLSAIVWGSLVVFNTEIFSLFQRLNFQNIFRFWISVAGVSLIIFGRLPPRELKRVSVPKGLDPLDKTLTAFLIFIPCIIAVTAWMSPPNNWDSLVYHMSRVAHWIQDQTVAHYPTSTNKQTYYPPWAGYAIMQFQILTGSDRLANFIQWFSMVGSMIAVSSISRLFGASLRYQIFSAFLALMVPMGLLQATTTQNDYVTAFWLACFVYFLLQAIENRSWENYLALGASLGLAMLTKATAYIYALPFLVWLIVSVWKKPSVGNFLRLMISGLVAVALNAGHFWRNWSTTGSILGESATSESTRNEAMDLGFFFSNIIRNIGLHLGTSIKALNVLMEQAVYAIHDKLGLSATDPRTTLSGDFYIPVSLHEDIAGNFCHLALIVIATFILVREWKKLEHFEIRAYFFSLLGGFFLFVFLLKWQSSGSRLHLPAFILWAPLISLAIERWQKKKTIVIILIGATLLASGVPYIARNSIRKLYSRKKATVFNTPRMEQYFLNDSNFWEPYRDSVKFIQSQKCSQIGLVFGSNVWEYPFWVLLKESVLAKDFRLEHVAVPEEITFSYPLGEFHPCALIERDRELPASTLPSGVVFEKQWESDNLRVLLPK